MKQQLLGKLMLIFTKEDLKRIEIKESQDITEIIVDFHGYTVQQARRFFNNLLNLVHGVGILIKIIHGYRHGTAIKEVIRRESLNKPHGYQIQIKEDMYNEGVTLFSFA